MGLDSADSMDSSVSGVFCASAERPARPRPLLGTRETFSFALINHKGRVHSKDYVFLNPIGAFDVAHTSSEFLRYPKSGGIYGCKKWVLDTAKLKDLPDILRPVQVRPHYFASERVVALVKEHGLTNFQLDPVEHVE